MAAYVILDATIHDLEKYADYRKKTPDIVAQYGGKFLARGGAVEVLEGDWKPGRVVVLEFATVEQAREWWSSKEYEDPKALRQGASEGSMILVEGV